MLSAMKEDGTWITLPERLTGNLLTTLKDSTRYFCPCCKTEMIIKAGTIKVPHFAHKNNSSCQASSEPESSYHLTGKRSLYDWFVSHNFQAKLEAYIPEIKKRTDILVTVDEKHYAIEFQCAFISESEFNERTTAYLSKGIIPIWILGAKRLQRNSKNEFSLSAFQWLFVNGTFEHPFLWLYCPETDQLAALKNITPFSKRTVFAELTSAPLNLLSPNHMSPRICMEFPFLLHWRRKRKSWGLHRVKTAKRSDPFFYELYTHHLSPSTIPIEIGIPIQGMFQIETPAIEWQAWLYMDVFQTKKLGEKMVMNEVLKHFKKRIITGDIKLRTLPLLKGKDAEDPVKKYIRFMEEMGYIKEEQAGTYTVIRQFTVPTTSDESITLESIFYQKSKLMIEKAYIHYNEI
ncbi:competence protein CoiA [Peribacillus sp. NPDC097675]|uniref:competence protein CoiA n=1 Tax=Peribacillus sp. NPDC097675 TaxID=3390618 RepID=UPI003D01C4C5